MKKIILRNMIFLYFRMGITLVVGLYTSRIILKTLGVEDFGIYSVISGLFGLLSFIDATFSITMQRFFSISIASNDKLDLAEKFNVSLVIQLFNLIVLILLSLTVGRWFLINQMNIPIDRIQASIWVFYFAIVSFAFPIIQSPFIALIIAKEKMEVFAKISILEVTLKLGLVYFLTKINFDKLFVHAFLMSILSLLVAIFYILYCKKNMPETKFYLVKKYAAYKEVLSFSYWSTIGSFSYTLKINGPNILLNLFFNVAVNAAYGIMQQLFNVVLLFVKSFLQSINPQIYKSIKNKESNDSQKIIRFGSRIAFYLVMLISLPLIIYTENFLGLWLTEIPEYSVIFIKLSMINILIDSISMPLTAGILATGQIKHYQLVVSVFLILNLPICYLFYLNGYPPPTFFYISISTSLIALIMRLFFLNKLINFNIGFFIQETLTPILLVLIGFAILHKLFANFIVDDGSIENFFYSIVLLISSIFISIFSIGITSDERFQIINKFKNVVFRLRY